MCDKLAYAVLSPRRTYPPLKKKKRDGMSDPRSPSTEISKEKINNNMQGPLQWSTDPNLYDFVSPGPVNESGQQADRLKQGKHIHLDNLQCHGHTTLPVYPSRVATLMSQTRDHRVSACQLQGNSDLSTNTLRARAGMSAPGPSLTQW